MAKDPKRSTTVGKVLTALEETFPPEYAFGYDNIGLQTGSLRSKVSSLTVALDPDCESIEAARKNRSDMLVTHHPLWMEPPKNFAADHVIPRPLLKSTELKIPIINAHTNADFAPGGLCDLLAKKLGLTDIDALIMDGKIPVGRIGSYVKPMTFPNWIKKAASVCGRRIRWSGVSSTRVARVALCSGSGSDLLYTAFEQGADILITGDVKYHAARESEEMARMRKGSGKNRGFILADGGHFGTETHFVKLAAAELKKRLPGLPIATFISKSPFKYMVGK